MTSQQGERIHATLCDLETAAKGFRERGMSDKSSLRLGVYWAMINSDLFTPEQARDAMSRIFNTR